MAERELILIVLLLTAAVMYGYFYFKRAQARSARQSAEREPASTQRQSGTDEG